MGRVTARRWALALLSLAFATSACGDDEAEGPIDGWERDGRAVQESDLNVYVGPAHCEWDDTLVLSLRWPLEDEDAGPGGYSFVRDPEGAMAEYTDAHFDPDAELPDDAVPTGYENDAVGELWLAADYARAYLVDGDTVEAWPAMSGAVCA